MVLCVLDTGQTKEKKTSISKSGALKDLDYNRYKNKSKPEDENRTCKDTDKEGAVIPTTNSGMFLESGGTCK